MHGLLVPEPWILLEWRPVLICFSDPSIGLVSNPHSRVAKGSGHHLLLRSPTRVYPGILWCTHRQATQFGPCSYLYWLGWPQAPALASPRRLLHKQPEGPHHSPAGNTSCLPLVLQHIHLQPTHLGTSGTLPMQFPHAWSQASRVIVHLTAPCPPWAVSPFHPLEIHLPSRVPPLCYALLGDPAVNELLLEVTAVGAGVRRGTTQRNK